MKEAMRYDSRRAGVIQRREHQKETKHPTQEDYTNRTVQSVNSVTTALFENAVPRATSDFDFDSKRNGHHY